LKKIVSMILSVSLIFGVASTGFASGANLDTEPKVTVSSTENEKALFSSDGNLIGTVKTVTDIKIVTEGKDTTFTYTEHNNYDLQPEYAAIPEYQETFADGTKTDTYTIEDTKVFKDGELVIDTAVADAPIAPVSDNSTITPFAVDTGGIPAMSHYYSTSDLKNYSFGTYSDVKFDAFKPNYYMGPAGSNVQKSIPRTHSLFNSAKSSIDSFKSNQDDYVYAIGSFLIASGTLGLTWATIVGAIASGGAAAAAAGVVIAKFNSCKTDIGKAYNYVSNF